MIQRENVMVRVGSERGLYECWPWRGAINGAGYGTYALKMAHRLVYEVLVGEVPAGMQLDHICRNRWCVNPAHLEVVSAKENAQRGLRHLPRVKGKRGTHCHRGHVLSGENLYLVIDKHGQSHRKCRTCRGQQRTKSLAERAVAQSRAAPGA